MTLLIQAADIDASSVKTLLVSFIGVLFIFITALYMYFKGEITGLKEQIKDERAYNKEQDNKNIETLIHVNNVLKQVSRQTEKTTDNIIDIKNISQTIKPIIEQNAERLANIKTHLQK